MNWDRFWAKVDKQADGCWIWTASTRAGYGVAVLGERRLGSAHRVAYELLVGPIPEGLQLDHLCRVRACVNPAHLEPVTPRENIRRGLGGPRTHCPNGHSYAEYGEQRPRGRDCILCRRERQRTYYWRRREAELRERAS